MAHFEIRLPEDIERGAQGGSGFNTTVITLSSGFEKRNQNWELTRGKWDIGYGLTTKSLLDAAINHFFAMRGKLDSFRFKDWSDFQIGNTLTGDISTRQNIGTGTGTVTQFQVFKRYTRVSVSFDRPITKLVSGTVRVFLAGVEKTEGIDYTVNYNTGVITFTVAPGSSVAVDAMCEFDVPVRFDVDEITINTEVFSDEAKISLPRITIVEVRV